MYFQITDMKEEEEDDVIGVGIARGMLDHSRMALCVFMLAVVAFNPFGVVLKRYTDSSSDYSATVVDGRTLQQVESKSRTILIFVSVVFILCNDDTSAAGVVESALYKRGK
jgi:hypothetical protein